MAHLNNRPVCGVLFRKLCFGDYVNMQMGVECHPLRFHYLMCKKFNTFDQFDLQELLFPVDDYQVWFNRKALCLVPDLRFGEYSPPPSPISGFRRVQKMRVPICIAFTFNESRWPYPRVQQLTSSIKCCRRDRSLAAVYARVRIFREIPSTAGYRWTYETHL